MSLGTSSGLIAGTPLQSGTFTFTVRAQDASDATNATTRSYTLSIASSPDLLVSALAAPAIAAAGSAIAVSDTTSNNGGGSAGASVTRFYFSKNSLFDATDVLLGSRPVSALGTGAVSSASTTVTLPAGLTSGTYYVVARADAAGDVPEGNESNNTRGGNHPHRCRPDGRSGYGAGDGCGRIPDCHIRHDHQHRRLVRQPRRSRGSTCRPTACSMPAIQPSGPVRFPRCRAGHQTPPLRS